MSRAAQLMTELSKRVAQHALTLQHIDANMRFDLDGESPESWLVRLEPPASVSQLDAAAVDASNVETDCLFRLHTDDFVALMTGKVTGQQLFFEGRLQVEGDLTMALKLRELTQILKG